MSKENITRIKAVYNALEELANEVAFVGGATVALYADRPAGEVRPTDDVDILVELWHYTEYAAIEERLREKGFRPDIESGIVGRYHVQGIVVDLMATSDQVLGFTNSWYKPGYQSSVIQPLDEHHHIRIFRAEYFVATKLEAFNNRGGGDGRMSSDFEDIVYILNHRDSIWTEMETADPTVRQFLQKQFQYLLENKHFGEWVAAHLDPLEKGRLGLILTRLETFIR